ncbi:uncharacterized protein BROUX77_008034 [Berkeleyomyces rouxiae]|uniref:uncharacterized protein n=1 Tax=Berkeleyomyces rouxiae TaxID=2035830 RepID=UPI003B7729C1
MEPVPNSGLPFEAGIRQLTLDDIDACELVENDAFVDPRYRATREKFEYRLKYYPELCLGLFLKAPPTALLDGKPLPTQRLAGSPPAADGASGDGKWFLVCHTIATRSPNPVVADDDMAVPAGWRAGSKARAGSTAAVHSFACVHAVQRKGLGRKLMASYVRRMTEASDIDSIALLCQDHLLEMYTALGYTRSIGQSLATFGGGGWNDMTLSTKN